MEMVLSLLMKVLALAATSGAGTELVKWLARQLVHHIPPKLVPLLSLVIGALAGELSGVGAELGAAGGMAATVLHQIKTQPMSREDKAEEAARHSF